MWITAGKINRTPWDILSILREIDARKGNDYTMKSLYICLLLLPGFIPGSDNESWTLKKMKDGILVYNRHSNLSKFNDIRVEVDLPGTIDQLSAILLDVEKYPGWVYATKSSTMMKKIGRAHV